MRMTTEESDRNNIGRRVSQKGREDMSHTYLRFQMGRELIEI